MRFERLNPTSCLLPMLAMVVFASAVFLPVPWARAEEGTVAIRTPSTVFLNLDAIEEGAPLPALPLWIEAFEIAGAAGLAGGNAGPLDRPQWEDPADLDFFSDEAPGAPVRDPIAYREQQLLSGLIGSLSDDLASPKDSPALPPDAEPAGGGQSWTVARLQLRPGAMPGDYLFLRVLFDDLPGASPVVTSWTESGEILFRSEPLGSGTGLPGSEGLLIPVRRAVSVEVALPGSGANLRCLFLSAARSIPSIETVDFAADASMPDPFGVADAPALRPGGAADTMLYGRVLATLDPGVVSLSPVAGYEMNYEFELEQVPQAGVVMLEVSNADPSRPPMIAVNGIQAGPVALSLPDLADPAYATYQYNASPDLQFRYTGWAGAQKFVSGSSLRAGLNRIAVRSDDVTAGIAVRAVRIQLKYPWQNPAP